LKGALAFDYGAGLLQGEKPAAGGMGFRQDNAFCIILDINLE